MPQDEIGADQLPLPVYIDGELPPEPTKAPTVGEHTDEILDELGFNQQTIDDLREKGAIGAHQQSD